MDKESKGGISGRSGGGLALLALLFCASLAMAQLDTGTVSGTVTDQSGGAIPGVGITIRNTETGASRSTASNTAGRYEAAALPAGSYEVTATLAGFQSLVRSGITLTVGRNAVVDMTLQVGEVTQSVTVTGEASFVETTTATVSNLVDEKRVQDIPLNNRDLTQLAFLQPGVIKMPINADNADPSVAGSGDKMSVAGSRATMNTFLLDGVSNADQSGNVASVGGAYEGAETIQEFQVITNNYSAEYSSRPGAIISAITKSGTNAFHGSVYEFLRNDNLDAAKWEDNAFPGGEKPEFKRNLFGGSVGGPILRDKMFFFTAYEGLRERKATTDTGVTISAAARTGNLGPNGAVNPATRTTVWPVNPAVVPYLNVFPLPGVGNNVIEDFGDGSVQVSGSNQRPIRGDFGTVKIDYQFGSPKAGFLSGTYNTNSAERQNLHFFRSGDSQIGGNEQDLGVTSRKHVISLRHTSVLSATMLNEFAFGYTHAKTNNNIPITDFDWSSLRWKDTAATMGYLEPGTEVTPVGFGATAAFFGTKAPTFRNNMTITLAAHTMKFGGEYRHATVPVLQGPDGENGRYVFEGLEFFLQGFPSEFDSVLPAGATVLGLVNQADPETTLSQNQFAFYFQDNWKALPSLTLNLGLRYEFQTELKEEKDRLSSFRDIFGTQVTVGGPLFQNATLRNFSPRVGFAWSPGSRTTSLRGGFGIFYAPTDVAEYQYVLGGMAPFLGEGGLVDRNSAGGINFPNAFRTQSGALAGSPNYRSQEFEQKPTRIYRWSLTVERELGNWFVSAGYSGSRALHLAVTSEANQNRWVGWPNNVPTAEKQFVDGTFINPLMARLTVTHMKGTSHYHGLGVNVMRRLTAGLQFQGAYNLAKSMDTSSSPGNNTEGFAQGQRAALLWDMDHWLGRSIFDIRHNFVSNFTYDVPRMNLGGIAGVLANGWQLNSIITLSQGHPFTLLDTNRNQNAAFERADGLRPNLVPGGNNDPVVGGPKQYYDPAQFAPSVCRGVGLCQPGQPGYAVGYFGNLGYNTVTGPGLVTVDFSTNKSFQITEGTALQLRAEFFNLTNRVNFNIPLGTGLNPYRLVGSRLEQNPTAGQITETRTSARQIQFGLRFTF